MTAEKFENLLNELKTVQPFHVFSVELNSGRKFEVDFPGALVNRQGVAVYISPGGVPIYFDHESVQRIIHAPANIDA